MFHRLICIGFWQDKPIEIMDDFRKANKYSFSHFSLSHKSHHPNGFFFLQQHENILQFSYVNSETPHITTPQKPISHRRKHTSKIKTIHRFVHESRRFLESSFTPSITHIPHVYVMLTTLLQTLKYYLYD